jgi:Type VI secretion system/phage-baseplate injector OB domain
VGANVWVECEGGDPNYPIWSGCFWGIGEMPAVPQVKVFKTDGITLTLNDLPGVGDSRSKLRLRSCRSH